MERLIGNYHPLAEWALARSEPSLSFLARDWPETEVWRTTARGKMHELLAFTPPAVEMNARTGRVFERDGVRIEYVTYDQPFGPPTEAVLLMPSGAVGRLPAVVALHDHGGFYYWGKEKITDLGDDPDVLREHKGIYGGRSWANDLAKRGYVVFVPDVFMFGSRRIAEDSLLKEFREPLATCEPGSRDYVKASNQIIGAHEHLVAKVLFAAGTTWPGVFSYDDRRAVDYLVTRPEVDVERIGCGGLSGGGLRTIYLAGLDSRISCAVCVGFMSTTGELLADKIQRHTWMIYVPHLSGYLDIPDIMSLHAPKPLMLQCDEDDGLFTPKGQHDSDEKLARIYKKMGAGGNYAGRFYPGGHKFDIEMQEDAFAWFDRWMK